MMKVAVADACIFIDVIDLDLNQLFFQLDIEIHTSRDVYNELNPEQKAQLQPFRETGALIVHLLQQEHWQQIEHLSFSKSLSFPDQTVVFLAGSLNAILLSSDKPIRKYAAAHSIEYHGMLWIPDELIARGLLSSKGAKTKLNYLIKLNWIYQNNNELKNEIQKRLKSW